MWNPKSWALESGIQLKESGIALAIGNQSQRLESITWNLESKTVLDSLTWGEL